MPADLDQFGRDNSHRAVIGGKSLVQLGHHASYGGGPFHQVDIVAGIGQIQGNLHAGNATTYHHHCTGFVLCHFFQPWIILNNLRCRAGHRTRQKVFARRPQLPGRYGDRPYVEAIEETFLSFEFVSSASCGSIFGFNEFWYL